MDDTNAAPAPSKRPRTVDADAFYGSAHKTWQEAVSEKRKWKPYVPPRNSDHFWRFSRPKQIARRFGRQADAFSYADNAAVTAGSSIGVFAEEVDAHGSRLYIVATMESFYDLYERLSPQRRHHYEVIREGTPCRLYFDLEFSTGEAPEINGARAVEVLVRELCAMVRAVYNIPLVPADVFDLDSSSETKFSRHLIVHIPHAVFADNVQMGYFVQRFEDVLETKRALDTEVDELLFVSGKSIIDTGVYTRNRCFRLLWSTKLGKARFLMPSTSCLFPLRGKSREQLFWDSLVSHCGDENDRLLTAQPYGRHAPSSTLGVLEAVALDKGSAASVVQFALLFWDCRAHMAAHDTSRDLMQRILREPESAVRASLSMHSSARQITHLPRARLLSIVVSANRYCDNIGRMHKSNSIVLCVDLGRGVLYQRCLDPDCRGFRSNEFVLPASLASPLEEPGESTKHPDDCGSDLSG